MNIKLIKLITGEEILTEIVSDFVDKPQEPVEIKNAVQVMLQQTGNKESPFTFGFLPWGKFVVGNIKISKDKIIYISDAKDDITDVYNQIFGAIAIPPKSIIT